MSVLIGHASVDENGKAHGGAAGDQTGREVCTRSWWARNWNICLRFKDRAKAEKAAAFVEQVCAGNMVGYDQYQRNTLRDAARAADWIGKNIKTKCETDCAAFMTVAAEAAGVNMDGCYLAFSNGQLNAPVTSTMRAKFAATGAFEVLTDSKYLTTDKYLLRGDILVREDAHTVMVLQDGGQAVPVTVDVAMEKIGTGSSGACVRTAQAILRGRGITDDSGNQIKVDGDFGAKTKQATVKMQKKLFPDDSSQWDGVWGLNTWPKALTSEW